MCFEPQGVLGGIHQRIDGPKDKYILEVFFSPQRCLNSKAAVEVRGELAAKSSQDLSSSTAHTGGRKGAESQASFQCSRSAAQALQTLYENMSYIISVETCFIRDMSTNNLLCIISGGSRLAL